MRLWSIHPKYLDCKGLVALWREAILAKKVLEGETKGYRKHPQLERFRKAKDPVPMINSYLLSVFSESKKRCYLFDKGKIGKASGGKINVTSDQIDFEMSHLKKKLKERDRKKYEEIKKINDPETHPLFRIVEGPVEKWERII
ncbi:MAG: hypothetical protein JW754_06185 [Candidatus Aenigmarchaeota archaeon]|nr:hypothetical protein [Candidatus Aenigmarchaeota archaeon]